MMSTGHPDHGPDLLATIVAAETLDPLVAVPAGEAGQA